MDNEKKPQYLEKILRKEGYKAVNEDPALDKKKVVAPLKDESATLPKEKKNFQGHEASRGKNSGAGRGIGGNTSSNPNQTEGEYKTPVQRFLEKGSRGSSGRGAGGPIVREPNEMMKEKNDVIKPDDLLSKKQDTKQKKQEAQQQQTQHKALVHDTEVLPKLSPREWMAKTLEANSPKEKVVAEKGDRAKTNIKVLIDKAIAEKGITLNPNTDSKEKSKEMAMNTVKSPSPKSIKR